MEQGFRVSPPEEVNLQGIIQMIFLHNQYYCLDYFSYATLASFIIAFSKLLSKAVYSWRLFCGICILNNVYCVILPQNIFLTLQNADILSQKEARERDVMEFLQLIERETELAYGHKH